MASYLDDQSMVASRAVAWICNSGVQLSIDANEQQYLIEALDMSTTRSDNSKTNMISASL